VARGTSMYKSTDSHSRLSYRWPLPLECFSADLANSVCALVDSDSSEYVEKNGSCVRKPDIDLCTLDQNTVMVF
jgi:hypothetical protein